MKREDFVKITEKTRTFMARGAWAKALIDAPTALLAVMYVGAGAWMLLMRDGRIWRFVLVPAATFVLASLVRKSLNRSRPYDALSFEAVGHAECGKGKSMPSRHAACAAAIVLAFAYAVPYPAVVAFCTALGAMVAVSRVMKGVHYPSDVLAALLFSAVCALVGYGCI